jgi:hypothetical protein
VPSLILPSGSGRECNTRKALPAKRKAFPSRFRSRPFKDTQPNERRPRQRKNGRSLTAGLGVLLTHGVDGACMQVKILAAPGGQSIQIEAARPALVPLERLKLSIVAEIPDEIAGARLAVKQSGERLDAVSIHQQHRRKLMPCQRSDKSLKLTGISIFRTRKSPNQEPHSLPGASARIFAPAKR